MRRFLALILVLLISIGISGCEENKSPIEDAKAVGESYMKNLYNIEDYKEIISEGGNKGKSFQLEMSKVNEIEKNIKSYITDELVKSLRENRDIIFIVWAARDTKSNILLDRVNFELKDNEKKDEMYFNYTATIKLTNDSEDKILNKKGQIQLVKIEDSWKVNRDKPFNYPLNDLVTGK